MGDYAFDTQDGTDSDNLQTEKKRPAVLARSANGVVTDNQVHYLISKFCIATANFYMMQFLSFF